MEMRYRLATVVAAESILDLTFLAWVGEWIRGENGQWVYEEDEEPLKG